MRQKSLTQLCVRTFIVTSLFLFAVAPAHSRDAISEKSTGTNAFGDRLPPGAIARLGTTLFRIDDRISALDASPDGKILAAATPYDVVHLLDAATGKELR